MDDLLGLSWDQKTATNGTSQPGSAARNGGSASLNGQRPGGVALPGMASLSSSGKVKPPVPPVSSKPPNFQMGSKHDLSNSSNIINNSINNNNSSNSSFSPNYNALQQPLTPKMNSTISSSASKKPAEDVFGSLMSSFSQGGPSAASSSHSAKILNGMTLDERRRYDQQQQFLGSLSSSPSFASPMSQSLNNSGAGTPTPRGLDPNNIVGSASFSAAGSPKLQSLASPTAKFQQPVQTPSRNQSPQALLASPGSIGRSLSPSMVPLQPERSNNSSPSNSSAMGVSRDPFDSLLGDQVSRAAAAPKNQSLNSIRYNTPPLGQTTSQPTSMAADPWDLDFLANATAKKPDQASAPQNNDVFDLGSFEHALPERPPRQRDSVDALNSFVGKQPSPISSPKPSPPVSKPPRVSHAAKVSTDEDARIAQIVSMGFTAERAKVALAVTESGRDIEAAIEYLLQNDEVDDQRMQRRQPTSESSNRRQNESDHQRPARRMNDDDDPPLASHRRRNQTQELSRAQQLQQQKDKLVGTASSFGMSMFSKANDLYKQGREKVQSVMEDMTAEDPRPTGAVRRHEWIDDAPRGGSAYKDSDSEDEVYKGRRQDSARYQQRDEYRTRQEPPTSFNQRDLKEKENFENTYVSSSRRGGNARANMGSSSNSSNSAPKKQQQPLFSMDDDEHHTSSSSQPHKPPTNNSRQKPQQQQQQQQKQSRTHSPLPSKPARPPRVLVQASSQQVAESNHYKEKGNEAFKLGQFAHAAELYLRAGQVLPRGHLLLVVVQNNRAAALLKTGEYRETVSESDKSIILITGRDGQGVHDVVPPSAGVNLKDQMGKALMRRATAYESLEKYKEAKDDWAKLRELDPGHKNAVEGHRRCEKALAMVNSGAADMITSPAMTRTTTTTTSIGNGFGGPANTGARSSPMQDLFASQQKSNVSAKAKADLERSEGVSKMRQTAAQQEREDDEKLRLRDQVDMKMTLWKAGKEDNIRALIASLGNVLWEGAGWKAVGMHELVTPQQVKIKYMRAIGKMHPDKLGASTTVEQRMMANTIFSTLNSAWDAFKAQNNL
ncbi:hypothetical protein BG004_004858 [Podila humilis]|nr:hypothetical protein BG004_004858 [Podila humilis]